jgi:hypothetical protein
MFATFNELNRVALTLYTDALVSHGYVRTRQHRVTDILNLADASFLVLEDVTVTEIDGRGEPIRAAYAQINLDAVLFAVADTPVTPSPELRTPKIQAAVLVSVPPFSIIGTIHLLPSSGDMREALTELAGHFLPVTDATYWSDRMGVERRTALMLAVNHRRAQILAQYTPAPGAQIPGAEIPGAPGDAPA